MQEALRADSDRDFWSGPSSSARRVNKLMVAGVAMAGASVMAVSPVTPSITDIHDEAVQMTAFANPLVELQETIETALTNLETIGANTELSSGALTAALTNPVLYAELAAFVGGNVVNPVPLVTQLVNFEATYGERIETQFGLSQTAFQTALNNLPTILQNTIGYLQTGQFVEAFSELNVYFLVQIDLGLVPLPSGLCCEG